ncbi:MAG TPA: hypothetical protein VHT05_02485 [Candidatus Elarobacter sp.]|jgi:hypothetical protein|nr:hypothetical protein [Candidatus Elarobacter sp.]
MQTTSRHRSADVAVGYAADRAGNGIAYAAVATGTDRAAVRVTFGANPLAALEGRELGYAAVTAVAAYLRGRGFNRVRLRIADEHVVDELSGRRPVPLPLAMAYVKASCALHGFSAARVERGEPIETHDLQTRASAEVALRAPAAA